VVEDVSAEVRRRWLADGKIQAVVVEAEGEVDNFMRDSIKSRIGTARNLGAEVVILKLDTYGGLVTAGLDISRFIKQQDDLYILCYVDDKAISAGAMIALACDAIAMEPASQIGDAGLIAVGPGGAPVSLDPTQRAKGESPVIADFRDSAERNGYSPVLAEAFVRVAQDVYWIENADTGERRFVDGTEYEQLTSAGAFGAAEPAWRDVDDTLRPIDGPEGLLTLSEIAAARIGLSTGTYPTVQDLATERGWTVVTTLRPSAGEKLVGFLSSYAVRGVLITLLFLGIYMSFSHPGTGLPEVASALCLAILFGVPWLTGFAQWYEVVLVLIGVLLLAVELFLIPGFGVAGIAGIIAILMGLAMTFVAPLAPAGMPVLYGVDWSSLGYGLLTVVVSLLCSVLLWFWLSRYLPSLPYANRLILKDEPLSPADVLQRAARDAAWPLPGMIGTAVSDLRPGGTARFAISEADPDDTANADVVSDRGFIPAGSRLAVVEVHGNRVVVRPAGGKENG
jgi:membrane-bound serine protease (ClpP class)